MFKLPICLYQIRKPKTILKDHNINLITNWVYHFKYYDQGGP